MCVYNVSSAVASTFFFFLVEKQNISSSEEMTVNVSGCLSVPGTVLNIVIC